MRNWINLLETSSNSPVDRFFSDLGAEKAASWNPDAVEAKFGSVCVTFDKMADDRVELDTISTSEDERGQGLASRALKTIVDKADEHGVFIELGVWSMDDDGLEDDVLRDWYIRYGFSDSGREDSIGGTIYERSPQRS